MKRKFPPIESIMQGMVDKLADLEGRAADLVTSTGLVHESARRVWTQIQQMSRGAKNWRTLEAVDPSHLADFLEQMDERLVIAAMVDGGPELIERWARIVEKARKTGRIE